MDATRLPDPPLGQTGETLLRRLLPPAQPATSAQVVEQLGLWERPRGPAPARPRVLLNMISTLDGRATLGGRSGPISAPADRELFHALRTPADAILVGAGTVRKERYGRLIAQESRRRLRSERGLPPEPLACVVSASLQLDPSIPLLAEAQARVLVITPSAGEIPGAGAAVGYVRAACDGVLDLARALSELAERHDVRLVLCEGGPHLAGELLAAGLLDELFLSLSPKLAGGEEREGQALRILAGNELEPPVELDLLGVLESDSHLFLHYGVVAPERLSGELGPAGS